MASPLSTFDKARSGLWVNLQKHLALIYAAEKDFAKASAFSDSFPFSAPPVDAETLADYWHHRNALRDLYTDETNQLDTLTKAIRTKSYSEDEKKQLYLLLLGYMDIASLAFGLLHTLTQAKSPVDEELADTQARFDRIRSFVRLNVKGIKGLLAVGV